ncbi:CBS domain-containing protein [Sandaracinus amylolyticus]|uniref:CBS domain-containing protein n=1 Tax=Sandaracinus amylolyticus TaxID=927083 RepID=UPI00069FD8FF|nr:CBS domain-containing protein [Sandaracinus amylolyticus]
MQKVRDIMTRSPACCSASTSLEEVARMMIVHDCGEIPVLDDVGTPIGVVTDRDIACRTVAQGKNPLEMTAGQVMSSPCVTVNVDDSIHECCEVLESNMIRRVPVVDSKGRCCGIVSQADVARAGDEHETAELLREISRPLQATSTFI